MVDTEQIFHKKIIVILALSLKQSYIGLGLLDQSDLGSLKEIWVKQSNDLGSVIQVLDLRIIRKQYLQVLDC